MKKKTRVASLKSLKIEKTAIMTLNAAQVVTGGKGGSIVVIDDPSIIHPTQPTQLTACYNCPPQKTMPPFCIF